MRKVKVGAIQPHYINSPEPYNCGLSNYRNIPDEIVVNYVTKQLEVTVNLLEKAGAEGCDIVTTCEDISGLYSYSEDITENNIYDELLELSQPVVESELARISRKYSMYVAGCYNKRIDGKNFNQAAIFDRNGVIVGSYRKTHLPPTEKWQNAEGDSTDVFELDFGKIGISICYDIMFQEQVQVLALKGAEIIFHPTAGYGWYESIGEATLKTRANDNSVYIATSKNYVYNTAGRSSIIDFWGHIMVDAGYEENAVIFKEIDLDLKKTQPDWYHPTPTSGIKEVNIRKLRERRPDLYGIICEPLHERFEGLNRSEQLEVLKKIRSGKYHW